MEENLILVKPDISLTGEITAYRQEFLDDGSSMDGCGSLRRHADPRDWLNNNALLENEATVPEKRVASTQYVFLRASNRRILGMIQVRHYFNDYLRQFGGHIGYSIRPSERRKGYAVRMLRDCLPLCRQFGLDKVLITCLDDNEGSRRTILANGGVYESTVYEPDENVHLQRYWIDLNHRT